VFADSQHGSPMASLMAYSHHGYPVVIKADLWSAPASVLAEASMAHLQPA